MERLAAVARQVGAPVVVIGDTKSPATWHLPNARFFDVAAQRELPWALARLLPLGHYARKNLGYLLAFQGGARVVFETDDDNAPLPEWSPRSLAVAGVRQAVGGGWFNVYGSFGQRMLWPRGLPLEHLKVAESSTSAVSDEPLRAPVQQGLANGSPDVDAVWRMVCERDVRFAREPSVFVPPWTWCPFNSQSTWWWHEVLPLMYLPSHCSFRVTDIWRSFVAQRCLWELGHGLVFHSAEVVQDRNPHDVLRDFEDEVPGYLGNQHMTEVLAALSLSSESSSMGVNLITCYEALVARGFLPRDEMALVEAWVEAASTL
jgi:hypothetical protein